MGADLTDGVTGVDHHNPEVTAGSTVVDAPSPGPRPSAGPAAIVASPWGRIAQAAVLAVPALLLLERAWDRRWMTDDGFINLRVARMIVDGHGPVFNVGERVEATTSALWVWIIAAGDVVLPFRMEWVAVLLGLGCAVAGLALATFGAARLHRARGATGLLIPAGALVVAVVTPFWDFSTSGLEGGLTFGWLGLTGWLLCRWAGGERRFGAGAAAVIGLGPLVRPDLTLVLPIALGGVLLAQWRDDRARDRIRLVAAALALPVAYEVFRMGYYASLVPNTALTKSGSRSRWHVGYTYLRDFVQPYWLVVPLACLVLVVLVPAAVMAWRRHDRRILVALTALPLAGLADGLYVVRLGGDYMHGRLLLPATFALIVPVAAIPLGPGVPASTRNQAARVGDGARATLRGGANRARTVAATGALAVVMAWSVLCLAQFRPRHVVFIFSSDAHAGSVRSFGEHAVTAASHGWGPGSASHRLDPAYAVYVSGKPVDATPPPGLPIPTAAGYGIGVSGYALGPDVYILDMLGLADPVGSRFAVERPGPTGHEKPIPDAWLAARISTTPLDPTIFPRPMLSAPIYESPAGRLDADTQAAREALRCGELHDLEAAVDQPMSPGRFLSNLVNAPRFTRLQVPVDPNQARERFCG